MSLEQGNGKLLWILGAFLTVMVVLGGGVITQGKELAELKATRVSPTEVAEMRANQREILRRLDLIDRKLDEYRRVR